MGCSLLPVRPGENGRAPLLANFSASAAGATEGQAC